VDIAVVHSDRSPVLFSGYFDSNYIHDFELHAISGFTTWIIGQVNALALDTLLGLLASISEANIICAGMEYRRFYAVLRAIGKMNPWWLRVGKHRDLRKGILESSRLKDTIRVTDSVCYGQNGRPKDSLDQGTSDLS
jgi:hypothetical protein